ncbi:glycoside hydrolase family 114 protein, partial [Piromyces sp. E2]
VDVHSTKKETIAKYHSAGKKVICYFSAGSYENFREDKEAMKKVSGLISSENLDGWDEKYFNIKKSGIKPIMEKRIKLAAEKHCDAIEADNLDVCQNVEKIELSTRDCVTYAKWLAKTAHKYDVSIGLKNSKYIAEQVAGEFDFAINESCFTHGKYCQKYKELFLDHNKAVFSIQY